MFNERISIITTFKDGKRKNYDWYDAVSSTMDDCFTTEEELSWYILESIADDEEIQEAVAIEAESVIYDRGKEVSRISVTIR